MDKYIKLFRQVFLFGVVGVISLLIDITVTTFLYTHLHFPPYLAGSIGFLTAFFFNFPINRKHVFNHKENYRHSIKTQAIGYAALSVFNLLVTAVFMQILVSKLKVKVELAKLLVAAVIAVWNFAIYKFLIFAKFKSKPSE